MSRFVLFRTCGIYLSACPYVNVVIHVSVLDEDRVQYMELYKRRWNFGFCLKRNFFFW